MRILYLSFFLLLITACTSNGPGSGNSVSAKELSQKEGLYYHGDSETPYTGMAADNFENGDSYFSGEYIDGKPTGKHLWNHENGNPKYEFYYNNGSAEGTWKTYYEDGTVESEMYYEDGKFADRKDFPKQSEAQPEQVNIKNTVESQEANN